MMGTIGLVVGLVAVILAFAKLKAGTVVFGIVAIILGILAHQNNGWIGLVLGLIAILLRFVLPKANGEPGQLPPIKPA